MLNNEQKQALLNALNEYCYREFDEVERYQSIEDIEPIIPLACTTTAYQTYEVFVNYDIEKEEYQHFIYDELVFTTHLPIDDFIKDLEVCDFDMMVSDILYKAEEREEKEMKPYNMYPCEQLSKQIAYKYFKGYGVFLNGLFEKNGVIYFFKTKEEHWFMKYEDCEEYFFSEYSKEEQQASIIENYLSLNQFLEEHIRENMMYNIENSIMDSFNYYLTPFELIYLGLEEELKKRCNAVIEFYKDKLEREWNNDEYEV